MSEEETPQDPEELEQEEREERTKHKESYFKWSKEELSRESD